MTIDSYVKQRGITKIDLVKIDIEGSEIFALRGMPNVLSTMRPDILIECNVIACGNFGYSYREILTLIESFGYRVYRILGQRLHPWDVATIQESICVDYFATTRQPANGSNVAGWQVCPMTVEETVALVAAQDRSTDLHRQYVRTISKSLPKHREIDEALVRWASLQDQNTESVLKVGAGLS